MAGPLLEKDTGKHAMLAVYTSLLRKNDKNRDIFQLNQTVRTSARARKKPQSLLNQYRPLFTAIHVHVLLY